MQPLKPTHSDYSFEPMQLGEAECKTLPALSEPTFYVPALGRIEPPSLDDAREELARHALQIWRMRAQKDPLDAVVFLNDWTSIPSIYVYVAPDGLFVPKLATAALEALIPLVFADDPTCKDILTQVRRPEHRDTEETLAPLGFETIGTAPAVNKVVRSYWLKRAIWDAYRGA